MNPILLDVPTLIPTDRLQLRAYAPGDGATYYRALRDNWDHLYEFMPEHYLTLQNEAEAEVEIRKLVAQWQLRSLFLFGIWEKESGRYIGETYLANADWHVPCIEVGYFLLRDDTGKGYATEAARAAIRFAFEHLHVRRVELQCAADNRASQRVAERCGFKLEGRFRRRHSTKRGAPVDRLWYGLLKEEWESPHLFQEATWPWGPTRVRFELMDALPPAALIANVNLVPYHGDAWVVLRMPDGSWEIPGGTLEPGETYLEALRRELMEEAGAHLESFELVGGWLCHSLAEKPYRPHLPFPEFYRIAGVGEIEIVGPPANPPGGETVIGVERLPLETAIERFISCGRHDLAELYRLAAQRVQP